VATAKSLLEAKLICRLVYFIWQPKAESTYNVSYT